MHKFYLIFTAVMASSVLQARAQASDSMVESDLTVITILLFILLAIFLFMLVRFWRTTNDIKSLKAKICNKGLAEKSIMRSEVMKLHLLNKDEEALEILNDALYNEARKLYLSTNDAKDYKGMVFLQSDDGGKMLSCQDYYEQKWKRVQEKYAALYSSINQEIPDGLKTVNYNYINQFGKNEKAKSEKAKNESPQPTDS